MASGLVWGAAPAAPRFALPPEEAPHEMTLMQWPVSRKMHPDSELRGFLQGTIANIANAVSDHDPMVMLAAAKYHDAARKQLGGADADAQAILALKRHLPGRAVIALNLDALGEVGGGIHCATQEVPKA